MTVKFYSPPRAAASKPSLAGEDRRPARMIRFPSRRLTVAAVALAALLAVAATSIASTSAGSQVKVRKTSLGKIVVDGKGRTLYLFEKDKGAKSSCYGACAVNWPPYLTTAKPTAGAGIRASKLGTTKRRNGKLQVTYNRHPLYRFKFDTRAGQTKGENVDAFGAEWYVVSPKGAKIEPPPAGPTGSGGSPPPPPPPPPYP